MITYMLPNTSLKPPPSPPLRRSRSSIETRPPWWDKRTTGALCSDGPRADERSYPSIPPLATWSLQHPPPVARTRLLSSSPPVNVLRWSCPHRKPSDDAKLRWTTSLSEPPWRLWSGRWLSFGDRDGAASRARG